MQRPAVIALFLAALAIAAYGPVHTFDFVNYDDRMYVYGNPQLQQGFTAESIEWSLTTTLMGNWNPLVWWSLFLDYTLFGLNPAGYHVVNLLFHAFNTALLFVLLRRLTGDLWPSALAAALFAVHPLHVESVAWVSARKDVLSAAFGLATILAYTHYLRRPRWTRYVGCLGLFALGLMAKPILVTLPCVLLLLDYWPLNRLEHRAPFAREHRPVLRKLLIEKVPLFVLVLLFSGVAVYAQRASSAMVGEDLLPMSQRFANAAVSYVAYLGKTVWPSGLIPYYPHPGASLPLWKPIAAAAFLLAATLAAWFSRARAPYVVVGWLWYLGTLVPTIGLVQVGSQAMADRYSYIPLIGIFIAVAWCVHALARVSPTTRRATVAIAAAAVLAFSVATYQQAARWKDSVTLFEYTLSVSPDNLTALGNLSSAYLARGDYELAAERGLRYLELQPADLSIHRNVAHAFRRSGELVLAEWHFRRSLKREPDNLDTLNGLGLTLMQQGEVLEAAKLFRTVIWHDSKNLQAKNNLGNLLVRLNRPDEAIVHFRHALRIEPKRAETLLNLGGAYLLKGAAVEAEKWLRQSLAANPNDEIAHVNLAVALESQGKKTEALEHCEEALRINPEYDKAVGLIEHIRRGEL